MKDSLYSKCHYCSTYDPEWGCVSMTDCKTKLPRNRVALTFNKNIVALGSRENGRNAYAEYARGKLNPNEDFYIEVPDTIKWVSSSFVQGFFEEIVNQIGYSLTQKRMHIICTNTKIAKDFKNKLI
ncbi:hypothetical protein J6A31_05795 [bacterium]|nr:hypothetical protein [bacterium]